MELSNDNLLMLLVTGITNFSCVPALYIIYHKGLYFQFYMGVFTFVTSFMYHSLESIEVNSFYITRTEWHKLDNIASIECFVMLMVYFMDNLEAKPTGYTSKHTTTIDIHLNLSGLLLIMLMQANHPWELQNTIYPILLYFFLMVIKTTFIRAARINRYYCTRGLCILLAAAFFFYKGLDDANDYLRIYHGLWHCCVGCSSFYLWQSIEKNQPDPLVKNLKLKPNPKFTPLQVLKSIFSLKFFTKPATVLPHYN